MVPPPDLLSAQNVLDIAKVAKEVIPRNTNFLRPLLEDSPLAWWKQHGHLFPTLSLLARCYLATPATPCPVERLFSVAGQVDAAKKKRGGVRVSLYVG
jgi:hypothetical protein